MTQILNNMKRKEKKGLFYLIGIAIMVAIMGISCSANATAPADFSETEDFVEVPAPEVKPEQTPQKPVLPIKKNCPAPDFIGYSFTDGKQMINIFKANNGWAHFVLDGEEYEIGTRNYNSNFGEHGFLIVNVGDNNKKGVASFTEDGYLKIWLDSGSTYRGHFELVK